MKSKEMTLYDVVTKLIGRTDPIGKSEVDEKRFENLEVTIDLVDKLLFDICGLRQYKGRGEASLNKTGERAYEYLKNVSLAFEEEVTEQRKI